MLAEWTTVTALERERALNNWRDRKTRLGAAGCHFWVFESAEEPGRFLEFTEAADVETLRAGFAQAGLAPAREPILFEVELF